MVQAEATSGRRRSRAAGRSPACPRGREEAREGGAERGLRSRSPTTWAGGVGAERAQDPGFSVPWKPLDKRRVARSLRLPAVGSWAGAERGQKSLPPGEPGLGPSGRAAGERGKFPWMFLG